MNFRILILFLLSLTSCELAKYQVKRSLRQTMANLNPKVKSVKYQTQLDSLNNNYSSTIRSKKLKPNSLRRIIRTKFFINHNFSDTLKVVSKRFDLTNYNHTYVFLKEKQNQYDKDKQLMIASKLKAIYYHGAEEGKSWSKSKEILYSDGRRRIIRQGWAVDKEDEN